ncbi:MAG: pilus assembly protein TadB [Betaproteobacteria bacterium]|jgi:tight adherence protein B|nr:pilus assembly protein TadB [Betaproteobacteria bacterium]
MESSYVAFMIVLFVAVLLALDGVRLLWQRALGGSARQLQRRVRALAGEADDALRAGGALLRERRLSDRPWLHRALANLPRMRDFDRWLAHTGWKLQVADAVGVAVLAALGAGLLARLFAQPPAVCVAAAVLAAMAWFALLQRQRAQRLLQLEQQLPDALDMMARSMQAGHSFNSALLLVGSESPQPVAGEFRQVFDEINHGVSAVQALQALTERMPSADLRFFSVAVLIQSDSGGNLAHILATIAALIRERQRLQARVRVLAAEGRLSAWILTLLPFVMGVLLTAFNRDFIAALWSDPLGTQIVALAGLLMAVGVVWMWRLVQVRV